MATALEIAREELPGVDDATLDGILWEETGFPCFFEGDPEQTLREQLRAVRSRQASTDG